MSPNFFSAGKFSLTLLVLSCGGGGCWTIHDAVRSFWGYFSSKKVARNVERERGAETIEAFLFPLGTPSPAALSMWLVLFFYRLRFFHLTLFFVYSSTKKKKYIILIFVCEMPSYPFRLLGGGFSFFFGFWSSSTSCSSQSSVFASTHPALR